MVTRYVSLYIRLLGEDLVVCGRGAFAPGRAASSISGSSSAVSCEVNAESRTCRSMVRAVFVFAHGKELVLDSAA